MNTNLFEKYGLTVVRGSQIEEAFGFPNSAVKAWGWIDLDRVAEALKMDPIDLIGKFDVLSKYYYDPRDEETIQVSYINGNGEFRQANWNKEWGFVKWVPAGWVKDILTAVEAGIDHFEVETTDAVLNWDDTDPDGNCWNSTYQQFGVGWVLVFAFNASGEPVPHN